MLDRISNACRQWLGGVVSCGGGRKTRAAMQNPDRRRAGRWRAVVLATGLLVTTVAWAQAGVSGQVPSVPPVKPAHPPTAPPAVQPPLFNSPSNIKARQIVQQAITALGGPAYLAEKDRSGNGRIYTFDSMGGLANAGTPFWSFNRFPDAERIELTKKRNVVYIYSGDKGWQITFRGVQPLPADAMTRFLEARDHSMDVVLRQWAQNPQTLMIYRGVNMVDQAQVESVDFSSAQGDTVTVDFDLNTHLPTRVHWRQTDPLTGGYYEKSITYGNFQMIDGINTPLIVQNFNGEQRMQQVYYENISYGPLPGNLFEPPAPKKK